MTKIPNRLTAENGAKALLIGEFYETIEVPNPSYCSCEMCDCRDEFDCEKPYLEQKVPVSWTNIKKIWAMAYDHFERQEEEAKEVKLKGAKESYREWCKEKGQFPQL